MTHELHAGTTTRRPAPEALSRLSRLRQLLRCLKGTSIGHWTPCRVSDSAFSKRVRDSKSAFDYCIDSSVVMQAKSVREVKGFDI